jgi:hypothetical protein
MFHIDIDDTAEGSDGKHVFIRSHIITLMLMFGTTFHMHDRSVVTRKIIHI